MATKDPLEGVTPKTTKEELMGRLKDAAAAIRKGDRQHKADLQAVEDRIRAKYAGTAHEHEVLRQVIISATTEEWKESVEFLEEFTDLLPVPLQRLVMGGRVLLGTHEAAG
jgi:hypothetical protein